MSTLKEPVRPAPVGSEIDAEALWRDHGPSALRLATVLAGPDDAHDVTVNAFESVVRIAGRAAIVNPRSYWLRAVANEAKGWHRSRGRRRRRDLVAVPPAAVAASVPDVDLRRAITELPVRQRAVLFLVYWEDMTEAAVAELLQLAPSTVHHTLVSARARLRRSLR